MNFLLILSKLGGSKVKKRIFYLFTISLCLLVYVAYQQWFTNTKERNFENLSIKFAETTIVVQNSSFLTAEKLTITQNTAIEAAEEAKSLSRGSYKENTTTKIIFDWTTVFNVPLNPGLLWACPDMPCLITSNRTFLNQSSAIVFHLANLNWTNLPPTPRSPQRYYILMSHEAPTYTSRFNLNGGGRGFFNLSMTYRRDSDIYFPYTAFAKRRVPLKFDWSDIRKRVSNKTRLLAWFVSNCETPSRREQYVKELTKHVPVDIYGKCGANKCEDRKICEQFLAETYKFYISFENSNCFDYVTEKFIERFRSEHYVVPIVIWKRNYIDYAPPYSYISVEDFKSPKDLAAYLLYLDQNLDEYLKYFDSRQYYENHACTENKQCGLCELCRRIQQEPLSHAINYNLSDWWLDKKGCDNDLIPRLLSSVKKST